MTFSGESRQPRLADDVALVRNLAGGLNTISGDLAIPEGDVPYLFNVDINDAGHVVTRNGTQYDGTFDAIGNDPTSIAGAVSVSYTTKAGTKFSVIKVGVNLYVYWMEASTATEVSRSDLITAKLNVWSSAASTVKPDYVITNENASRIIFASGVNVPVQLQFIESSQVVTEGAAFTTVTVTSSRYANAAVENVFVWIDGTRKSVSNVSFNTGTNELTITIDSTAAGTYAVEVVFITWQWLCEGILLEGSQVYESVTRFHSTESDKTIAVPTNLIRNYQSLEDENILYPLIPYLSSNRGAYYTYDATRKPDTVDEFVFSNGIAYDSTLNSDEIVPGVSHLTFGAVRDNVMGEIDPPEEVHLVRAVRLDFDDDSDTIEVGNLLVLLNGTAATRITSSTIGSNTTTWNQSYVARTVPVSAVNFYNSSSIVGDTSTSPAKYITFDGSEAVGIPPTSVIEIIHARVPTNFVGSNANATVNQLAPGDGYAVPAHGIQEHASYSLGSFPRAVTLYQGRLVFGGFPADPLKVITSEVIGTSRTGFDFVNYSIAWENLEQTDPVVTRISTNQNNASITALNTLIGNIFVFTVEKTFRVSGGSSVLSPTSVLVQEVADVGAVNAQSVIGIENTLVFLSLAGVYRVAPSLELGDFNVTLLSVKVNTEFKNRNNIIAGWLVFDRINNRLFAGIDNFGDSDVATELYVLNFNRNAWFRYSTYYGYWYCAGASFIDLDNPFIVFLMPTSRNNAMGLDLVFYPYFYATDFTRVQTPFNLTDSGYDEFPLIEDSITVSNNEVRDTYNISNFRLSEFSGINDVTVILDGEEIQFGTDFRKIDEGQLDITRVFSIGASLVLRPRNTLGRYPILLYLDNIFQEDLTLSFDSVNNIVTVSLNASDEDTIARIGTSIPCFYSTPVLVRNSITGRKLSTDLYAVLLNANFQDKFREADVNTSTSQDASSLIGNWQRVVNVSVSKVISAAEIDFVPNTQDALGFQDLYWDLGSFDSDSNARQLDKYSRIQATIKGSNNFLQVFFYTYGEANVFELIAYQIVTGNLGRGNF